METDREREVKVGQLLPPPTEPVFGERVAAEQRGDVSWGVEPAPQPRSGISPRASLFRCAPRLSLTRRRSQMCHIRAVAQTQTPLCFCLPRVTLITPLIETRLKEVDEVAPRPRR